MEKICGDVMDIRYEEDVAFEREQVIALYSACGWSSAQRPDELMMALENSHSVTSAWHGEQLVGLINAISDGALVVYYPHLLVLPEARRQGIARELLTRMRRKYDGFHQQVLLSYQEAAPVYEKAGFVPAPQVVPFWIYSGD